MAETDILNADIRWRRDIQDAIGPDYGFQMLRSSQLATAKAPFGSPIYRTIGNGGHTGQFSWLNRSQRCIQKLKQWAEQHEDGYFTLIDHDWGGRHYVGNFVGDMPWSPAGNDRYNIQGWQFVETPGAPMLQYPSNWDDWAVMEYPFFDGGTLRCAFTGAWVRPAATTDDDGNTVTPNSLVNSLAAVGDSITHEYRGYGFRLWMNQSSLDANVTVTIDGGQAIPVSNSNGGDGQGMAVALEMANISLGIHRVVITVSKGGTSTYGGLQVMR